VESFLLKVNFDFRRCIFGYLIVISFVCATNSMLLNCDFKYLKDMEETTNQIYTCQTINFTNTLQKMPINYVTNMHEMGKRDRDVKVFIIKHQVCVFLPTKIENFFPHLEEIEVDSSGLKLLQRENFASLPLLKMAIFPGNDIEYLPDDLFANNQRLTHLDFSRNKIKSVGRTFFENLYELKYVAFDDNLCFQGFGMILDVETIKDEVLANCSAVVRQEKRIKVIKMEEVKQDPPKPKIEVKEKIQQKDEKSQDKPKPQPEEPRHVKSHSNCQEVSQGIIAICFHFACFCHFILR
jgi:hypothetical protein